MELKIRNRILSVVSYQLSVVFTFVSCLLLPTAYSLAQDAFFSQYNSIPLFLNPAHTGNISDKWRTAGNYKNHWKGYGLGNVSALSFDMKCFGDSAKKEHIGIGAYLFNDKIGDFAYSTTDAGISFAFHTKNPEKKQHFSIGLQAGIIQKSLNVNQLTWSSQFVGDHYDNTLLSEEIFFSEKILRENFSAGALWQHLPSEKFNAYCGMSVYHINRPDVSFMKNNVDKLESRFSVHAGADIGLGEGNFILSPRAMYFKQGSAQRNHLDFLMKKNFGKGEGDSSFSGGISYRFTAIAPVTYIEIKGFKLGISYDLNLGDFQSAFGNDGGIEISLSYLPFRKESSNASFNK